MPSRHTSMLVAVAAAATFVAVLPMVRAERAVADAACPLSAHVTRPGTVPWPPFSNATAAPTPSIQGTGSQRTLTVTGTGAVARAPDTLYFDLRLTANAPDALSAACENERAYAALRTQLGPIDVEDTSSIFQGSGTYQIRATPPPAGASQPPARPPGWASNRSLRIVAAPAKLRDIRAAVDAVHGTATAVQFGVVDREAAYEGALTSAIHDATADANEFATSHRIRLGRLVRVEIAPLEPSSVSSTIPIEAARSGAPDPVLVTASLRITFPIASAASAVQPAGALVVVHPFGTASRPPDVASLSIDFSDRDNDRTAMLYRHETAYDALWAKLRRLGIDPSQVANSAPQALPNHTAAPAMPGLVPGYPQPPIPSTSPTPFLAYALYRQVHVNSVPVAKVPAVIAAFAEARATTAEVAFGIADRASIAAEANADLRRNAALHARAVAAAAGLRIVEPPYLEGIGYPLTTATIYRTPIGSPDRPRVFEPPARIDAVLRGTAVYAATP